ncbi:hypothetical protein Tsubulata_040076 [Turnera subulata]|uniref:Uncharacterized protein n=1 Tax=Turnera subulata TaxID=218843 RepID=A0A9Q0J5A3_9ROSI|nr:hypothetical protein Tsubulata_040076 [Turnera subulata]
MDKKNGLLDLSSFLLVEGSADSEADYGVLKLCLDMNIPRDEDDAESCSWDTSDAPSSLESFGSEDHDQCSHFNDADKSIFGKPTWSSCKVWFADAAMEYVSAEDGEEETINSTLVRKDAMDQMEDRLFWETCMAVGYP